MTLAIAKITMTGVAAVTVLVLALGTTTPVRADSDTALGVVGGLMIGKMVSDRNKQRQEDAYREGQREQYYAQQQRQNQQQQASQPQAESVESRLKKLKSLHDQELITDEDYEQRKAEILKDM